MTEANPHSAPTQRAWLQIRIPVDQAPLIRSTPFALSLSKPFDKAQRQQTGLLHQAVPDHRVDLKPLRTPWRGLVTTNTPDLIAASA